MREVVVDFPAASHYDEFRGHAMGSDDAGILFLVERAREGSSSMRRTSGPEEGTTGVGRRWFECSNIK